MCAKRTPRMACVATDAKGNMRLTMMGLAHVLEMATLGCGLGEIAQYLRVSHRWLASCVDEDHENFNSDIADQFEEGASSFKRRLREHQLALSESNAQMAIHLGKHFLDQREVREIDINAKIQLVGTLPDYSQSADDWRRMHAPSALQPSHILEAQAVETFDAEVLANNEETVNETRRKDGGSN